VSVSCFLLFLCFRKLTQENILKIGRNKSRTSGNLPKLPENRRGDGEGPQGSHTTMGGVCPGPCPLVRTPWSTSGAAPSPIKTPRRGKPKHPITFLETHHDPPPSSTQDREGPEALPDTLPERGIATGGLLHRHFASGTMSE
jgi:hypothetical protein